MSASEPDLTNIIALGGAGFSLAGDRDERRSIETIRAAAEAGVRVFDSARAYAPVGDPTHNERLFARALLDIPNVVIATKGGHFRVSESEWAVDNGAARLRLDVDNSLRALAVERVGLYYLHRADASDSIAEAVATLDGLRVSGKLAAVGLSNVTRAQLDEALSIAPIAAVQNERSVVSVDADEVLERCEQLGIPFFAYSPLSGSGGDLTARLPRLAAVAAARGVSVQRLALRGLLADSPVLSLVVGAGRPVTATDSAAAESERWDEPAQVALDGDRADLASDREQITNVRRDG